MKRCRVKICGLWYDVRVLKKKNEKTWGTVEYAKTEIILYESDTLSSERKLEVLMHECIHALLYESTANYCIRKSMEETLVSRLAAPLAAFIRDNAALLRRMS